MNKGLLKIILLPLGVFLFLSSCGNSPKVIEGQPVNAGASPDPSTPLVVSPGNIPGMAPTDATEHRIKVVEVLDTDRYTYMLAEEEGQENYWVAISKRPVTVGEEYIYRGGLLKRNFFSAEYNRTFETLYLVSEILPLNPVGNSMAAAAADDPELTVAPAKVDRSAGSVKISEVISSAEKMAGQTIKITGKCVKINPNIMGRNWLHIKDDSGEEYDLTVTTTDLIQLGEMVTLQGTLNVNRDFGAGYYYAVILEDAIRL